MKNLLTKTNTINTRINKKIYNIKAEKLVREASDNFVYFRDHEMALEQIHEALAIDPANVKALVLKANLFLCIEENNIAKDYIEKALDIDPYFAEAYSLKANLLESQGNLKESLECCKKALENIKPNEQHLLSVVYDLKISLLIRLKKYEEAKHTLKKSYMQLKEEDSSYIASCYRDIIENFHKEKTRKKKIVKNRLMLVHSA